jgi:hypothetical protein
VIVWLYKCPSSFSTCDGSGKKWFKISQVGMLSPPLNGKDWGQTQIATKKQWTVKIPALAAGNYLLRHEIITIHTSNAPQFYAECAQLSVNSSGGGASVASPSAQYLAEIPGYAPMNHPGLKVGVFPCEILRERY